MVPNKSSICNLLIIGCILTVSLNCVESFHRPPLASGRKQNILVRNTLQKPCTPNVLLHATSDGEDQKPIQSRRMMSWPFQMFPAPELLDGSLACDAGFDPLGIVKSKEQLFILREAEIKHARIAMLAAIGWPVSELCHYTLAKIFGVENLLSEGVKAPSVLNGGLDNAYVLLGLGLFFAVGAVLEFEYMKRKKEVPASLANFYNMWQEDGWDVPGNYDFDPLNLRDSICGVSPERKIFVQSLEMINGRVAMLATVGFALQEAYTGLPVIEETPDFFYPFFFD